LFYGDEVIEVSGESLLGSSYNISVADLARGMAMILLSGFPNRAATARFRQGDDSLEIDFSLEEDHVLVSTDGRQLRVHKQDFLQERVHSCISSHDRRRNVYRTRSPERILTFWQRLPAQAAHDQGVSRRLQLSMDDSGGGAGVLQA
jgi:hypothetical protein